MKLYYSPGVCSLSPHIALREAGINAELIKVDIANHTLADGSDLAPGSGLAPAAGTLDRYRLQEWLGFVSSELHKAFGTLFNASIHASTKASVMTKLRSRLDWTSGQLQAKRFALGDRFSVAVGYLYTVLAWLRFVGMDIADWPVLAAHSQRVASRPAVRAALRAEGLIQG